MNTENTSEVPVNRVSKQYLGDAVYAQVDAFGTLILTVENGISCTDTILIDSDTLSRLEEFINSHRNRIGYY